MAIQLTRLLCMCGNAKYKRQSCFVGEESMIGFGAVKFLNKKKIRPVTEIRCCFMNPINRIKIRININKVPYGNLNKYNFYYINKKNYEF